MAGTPMRLRRDALTLQNIIAATLANIAPAMSFFFGFAVIVEGAGLGSPLTILLATISILLLAHTLSEFSRETPSTGSFVTFMGRAFGPATAATTAVFLIVGYAIAASSVVAIAGGWAHDTILRYLGLAVPWQAISLVSVVFVGWLVARGVHLSTVWAAVFFYFETGLLLIGALLILAHNWRYASWTPFDPARLPNGIAGIGLGFPLAVYLFIGWENAATLAEETRDARRNVPRALFISTVLIGVFYLFLAWVMDVGFHNDAKAIAKSSIPFVDAMQAAAGSFVFLAYLAGLTSIFSSLIGLVNAQGRILFSAGREGLLPRWLGGVHSENQTPWRATSVYVVFSLALVFIFGWKLAPVDYFGDSATLGTIPVLLVYAATNLALPFYMRRHAPARMRMGRHVLLPLLGFLVMLYPIWGLIQPGQPAPFNLFPWIVAGLLAISIIYGVVASSYDPGLGTRVGSVIADE